MHPLTNSALSCAGRDSVSRKWNPKLPRFNGSDWYYCAHFTGIIIQRPPDLCASCSSSDLLSCLDVEKISSLSVLIAAFVHLCCDSGWGSLIYELAPPCCPCMPTTWASHQCRPMTGRSWAAEVKDWCVCGRRGWGRSCGRCTTGGLLPSSEPLRGWKATCGGKHWNKICFFNELLCPFLTHKPLRLILIH